MVEVVDDLAFAADGDTKMPEEDPTTNQYDYLN